MSRANSSTVFAEAVSWYAALLLSLMLVLSYCEPCDCGEFTTATSNNNLHYVTERACDEIYVVREGETLHTISEKCGDPWIVEENPHIHDPDDVFPGLVIKITPFNNRP